MAILWLSFIVGLGTAQPVQSIERWSETTVDTNSAGKTETKVENKIETKTDPRTISPIEDKPNNQAPTSISLPTTEDTSVPQEQVPVRSDHWTAPSDWSVSFPASWPYKPTEPVNTVPGQPIKDNTDKPWEVWTPEPVTDTVGVRVTDSFSSDSAVSDSATSDNSSANNDTSSIPPRDESTTITQSPEVCNDKDDDGDGQIDEGVRIVMYRDLDQDGYGNGMSVTLSCGFEPWYVTNSNDCDDTNSKKTTDCSEDTVPAASATITTPLSPTPNVGSVTTSTLSATPTASTPTPNSVVTPYTPAFVSISQADSIATYSPSSVADTWIATEVPLRVNNTSDYYSETASPQDVSSVAENNSIDETPTIPMNEVEWIGVLILERSESNNDTPGSWRWGSMCGNGVCELVVIDWNAALEPMCPQDCELSCEKPLSQNTAQECVSLIQQDSVYLSWNTTQDTTERMNKLRVFEHTDILTAITQPFTFAGDSTLRLDINIEHASFANVIALLYRVFGDSVRLEPVPVFTTQTTAGQPWISKNSDQRYLDAMNIPHEIPACIVADADLLVWVVDNAFDTRHPVFVGRVHDTYDSADGDRTVWAPKLGTDREHWTIAAWLVAWQKNARSTRQWSDLGTSKLVLVKATKNTATNGNNITSGIEGISRAAELGARIIVTSRGSSLDVAALKRVVKGLSEKGVLVVAAAGNYSTNKPFYPAAYPEVFAVAAVDKFMTRASFSNYGYRVDVVAPGVEITAPIPWNRYKVVEWTSEAAPLAAGVLAAAAALWLGVDDIISSWESIDRKNTPSDLGKWVIQFPVQLCNAQQWFWDDIQSQFGNLWSENNQPQIEDEKLNTRSAFTTQSVNISSRDTTREMSVIDVLLRTNSGPTLYHASAPEQPAGRGTLRIGRVSGVCTVLVIAIGIRALYIRREKKKS